MVTVKFEDARSGRISPAYGPFTFVQVTYAILRDDLDTELAVQQPNGEWLNKRDKRLYSDMVTSAS